MPTPFATLSEFLDLLRAADGPDAGARKGAADRNAQLTKPAGSLGRLEDVALHMAAWQGAPIPMLNHPQVAIFAGNHGITAQGVSAFPAEVTAQMVTNFQHGGAAINQLCAAFGATLTVTPLSLDTPTGDFTEGPAMDEAALIEALRAGWHGLSPEADLFIAGEMGIGNTTSAAAIAAALFGGSGRDWAGRGTGIDDAGLTRKAAVIEAGLTANPQAKTDPMQALRCLGGRELAAMAGGIAHARVRGVPVLLDGFICTAAAAVLDRAVPGALDHALAGHVSAEPGHARLLGLLGKDPLLSLDLRLGEGSGAATALGIVKAAIACHAGMATFAEAGVADG